MGNFLKYFFGKSVSNFYLNGNNLGKKNKKCSRVDDPKVESAAKKMVVGCIGCGLFRVWVDPSPLLPQRSPEVPRWSPALVSSWRQVNPSLTDTFQRKRQSGMYTKRFFLIDLEISIEEPIFFSVGQEPPNAMSSESCSIYYIYMCLPNLM